MGRYIPKSLHERVIIKEFFPWVLQVRVYYVHHFWIFRPVGFPEALFRPLVDFVRVRTVKKNTND